MVRQTQDGVRWPVLCYVMFCDCNYAISSRIVFLLSGAIGIEDYVKKINENLGQHCFEKIEKN